MTPDGPPPPFWKLRKSRAAFLLLTLFLACLVRPTAAEVQAREPVVKAVFVERFTRFVEWPVESKIEETTRPFVLGVYGESPMFSALRNVYATQLIRKKAVAIREIKNLEDAARCHLVVIGRAPRASVVALVAAVRGKAVLTVGDGDGYGALGVHVTFVVDNESQVRFEINERRVRESGLRMSYQLLKLARIVVSPDEGGGPP